MTAKPVAAQDWSILAGLVVAWGSSFALTKIAVSHLDPAWVAGLRLAIAAVILLAVAATRGDLPKATRQHWRKFTWLGFIGHALPFFLISWGTLFVPSGVSGLLMGAIPLILIVMAHYTLPDEPLTLPKALGFLLGFLGIAVLLNPDDLKNFSLSGGALMGEIAIIVACLCYAIHSVSARRMGFEAPLTQASGVMTAGAAFAIALALARAPHGLADQPAPVWWAVLGLGILPTAIATLLMYRALERVGASFVSTSNYLVPLYAVLFGWAVLGEALSWRLVAALAFILTGIAVSRLTFASKSPAL